MDIKTIVNSLGLILTILGVYIAFVNSPINEHTIIGILDFKGELKKTVDKKNRLLRAGIYMVIFGSIFQLISNFISC